MKVVISCDAVVVRDWYIEVVEAALDVLTGIFGQEQFELYTLVHNQGAVIGPLEQRKVHSSFLSNLAQNYTDLLKNNYLVPNAAKNLFIPCSADLIINISRGFSHGINKCEKTKQLTFLVEDINALKGKRTFKQKIFSSLVTSFQAKKLKQADILWTSNKDYLPKDIEAKVVSPCVKLGDYKILPDAMFQRDYVLVNASALEVDEAREIIEQLKDTKFKFIGADEHLEELKEGNEALFFGDRCGGEMAPLLNGCKYLIDYETELLPVLTLRAMACGRPVFSKGNKFLDFGPGYYEAVEMKGLGNLAHPEFDKNEVRGRALKFEELKFKHLLKRTIEEIQIELSGSRALYNVDPDNCC